MKYNASFSVFLGMFAPRAQQSCRNLGHMEKPCVVVSVSSHS